MSGLGDGAVRSQPAPRRRSGFTAYEEQLVADLRAKGRGWQSVSEALGRPMPDIRGHFDPTYRKTYVAAPAPVAPAGRMDAGPTPWGRRAPIRAPRGPLESGTHCGHMLVALAALGRAARAAEMVGGPDGPRCVNDASKVLSHLRTRGLVTPARAGESGVRGFFYLWTLTPEGVVEAARIRNEQAAGMANPSRPDAPACPSLLEGENG